MYQNLLTFSDGCARGSFLMLQPDLLQRHQVVCQFTASFKHCGVSSLKATHSINGNIAKLQCEVHVETWSFLTSPSLSSLMYVSNFPKPISD